MGGTRLAPVMTAVWLACVLQPPGFTEASWPRCSPNGHFFGVDGVVYDEQGTLVHELLVYDMRDLAPVATRSAP